MSARPDLTTEELLAFVERQCANSPWTVGSYYRAIAQRLRSERPAVTPEMVEAAARAQWQHVCDRPGDPTFDSTDAEGREESLRTAEIGLRAALSVSSTEGKHGA